MEGLKLGAATATRRGCGGQRTVLAASAVHAAASFGPGGRGTVRRTPSAGATHTDSVHLANRSAPTLICSRPGSEN